MDKLITQKSLQAYGAYLRREEKSGATREKYLHDVGSFARWLEGRPVTREAVAGWKDHLLELHYAPTTVNAALAALNSLFRFLGWEDCRARFLKVQHRLFRPAERELTRRDYDALIAEAQREGRTRLALLMETICATGIRVGEVKYITLQAVQTGRAEISLKGKVRTILIPGKLCRKLKKYAKKQKTASGEIFLTRSGAPLSRRQIWAEMKALCEKAGVEPSKVFPHNLRHLFATLYYKACKDIARLADVLGHSSIETTRIYLLTSGEEHRRQLERLQLVT